MKARLRDKVHDTLKAVRHIDAKRTARMVLASATEGWYAKGDEQSGNRRNHLFYNYTANAVANLIGGNFLTGLLLYLGANDSFIGLIAIVTFSANLLQLFAPLLLERFTSRKKLLISAKVILHLFNIVFIGLIPFFPIAQQGKLAMVFTGVLIVNALNAIMAPGFSIWHIQFLPQRVRTRYFPMLTMTNGIVVALVTLAASGAVDLFKAQGLELWGLTALRFAALGVAALDIFLLTRMKEYPYDQAEKRPTLFQLLVEPFRHTGYLRIVAVAFLWSMVANMPGSYYTVYLLKDVQVSYSFITLCSLINIPVLLFLTPVFSRVLRRYSWLKTLNASLFLYLLHYFILATVMRETLFLYPIALVIAYVLAVGINLSFTGIPYINIPQKNQTIYIGFYSTMSNLGALIGAAAGRQFIALTENVSVHMLGLTLGNKQLLVALVGALMFLMAIGVFFLRRNIDDTE